MTTPGSGIAHEGEPRDDHDEDDSRCRDAEGGARIEDRRQEAADEEPDAWRCRRHRLDEATHTRLQRVRGAELNCRLHRDRLNAIPHPAERAEHARNEQSRRECLASVGGADGQSRAGDKHERVQTPRDGEEQRTHNDPDAPGAEESAEPRIAGVECLLCVDDLDRDDTREEDERGGLAE